MKRVSCGDKSNPDTFLHYSVAAASLEGQARLHGLIGVAGAVFLTLVSEPCVGPCFQSSVAGNRAVLLDF